MTKKLRGFTLIEILITTTIMIVFTGLSFAGYRYFNEQRKFEEETKRIVSILELAKKMATTGQQPPSYIPGNTNPCHIFNGGYLFQSVSNNYKLYATNNQAGCFSTVTQLYNLPSNFQLVNNTPGASFGSSTVCYGFRAFGNGVASFCASVLDAQGGFSLKITNTIINKFKIVNVDRAGIITLQ
ncbi:MAG TPA: hypothetical protein VJB63_01025 [Patescibacteria group bacterium]|nr:hypothetical protein [Patescibacteria group bacterium]